MSVDYFKDQRQQMLATIRAHASHLRALIGKTAFDDRVLKAMARVPRHEFVPVELQPYAYEDMPVPIGFEKTISQPFMVAVMTDLLELQPDDTVPQNRHLPRVPSRRARRTGRHGVQRRSH
jgi:protein-L-isoaspartate(D-aspartate) O-methyltransferase